VCPGKTGYQVYATASLNCFSCNNGLQLWPYYLCTRKI
jgi:hypothetical protein